MINRFVLCVLCVIPISVKAQSSFLQFVNTLQGTDSNPGFSHGGTLPMVGSPWPMLQWAAIGQPWKTQYWTHRVCRELYNSTPEGFCGDEDNGEMSSWYLLSSIGLFPACVGDPKYTLTSPMFDRITLHLNNGRQFVINTAANNGNNVYVESRKLDDSGYEAQTISHERLMQGGELSVQLGAIPKTSVVEK